MIGALVDSLIDEFEYPSPALPPSRPLLPVPDEQPSAIAIALFDSITLPAVYWSWIAVTKVRSLVTVVQLVELMLTHAHVKPLVMSLSAWTSVSDTGQPTASDGLNAAPFSQPAAATSLRFALDSQLARFWLPTSATRGGG